MTRHVERLEFRRLMDAGQLDTSFADGDGFIEIAGNPGQITQIVDLDADPQGDILLTIHSRPRDEGGGDATRFLARFHADGSPATWFGDDGRLPLPVDAAAVHVAPDGGILLQVAGHLRKYCSNGRLAREFADDGVLRFDRLPQYRLDLDRAGNIYVVGRTENPQADEPDMQVMRFRRDGSRDADYWPDPSGSISEDFFDFFADELTINVLYDGRLMVSTASSSLTATGFGTRTLTASGRVDFDYGEPNQFGAVGASVTRPPPDVPGPAEDVRVREITEDGHAFFEITQYLQEYGGSIGEEQSAEVVSIGPDGFFTSFRAQFDPEQDTRGGFLHHEGYFIAVSDDGPEFYDDAGAVLAAPTSAARQATQWDGSAEQTLHKLITANDGTLLVAAQRPPAAGNDPSIVRLYRLFSGEAPAAQLQVRNLTQRREASYRFTIQYRDDDGVDLATLGDDDVTVALPGGGRRKARLLDTDLSDGGRVVTATYRVTAPDGVWDAADNGVYTVRLERRSVRDTGGVAAAQRPIGVFHVAIASSEVPITSTATTARPVPQPFAAARDFDFDSLNRRESAETDMI